MSAGRANAETGIGCGEIRERTNDIFTERQTTMWKLMSLFYRQECRNRSASESTLSTEWRLMMLWMYTSTANPHVTNYVLSSPSKKQQISIYCFRKVFECFATRCSTIIYRQAQTSCRSILRHQCLSMRNNEPISAFEYRNVNQKTIDSTLWMSPRH